jgi:acetyl-CoA acetyltransferase
MAGLTPTQVDAAEIYDCYTITVLLTLEDAGFCAKGDGMAFIRDQEFGFAGGFPLNTHGGQLGMGQAGLAGGMTQVVEAARQVMGSRESRDRHSRRVCDWRRARWVGKARRSRRW